MSTITLIIVLWLLLIAFCVWFSARLYFRTEMLEERCRYHWGEIHSLFKKIIETAEKIQENNQENKIDWKDWENHKENAKKILKMSPSVFADEWLMRSFLQAQDNFFKCNNFYFEKYKDLLNEKDKEILYGLKVQLITLFHQYNRASETYQKQRNRLLVKIFSQWWFWKNYKPIEINETNFELPALNNDNLFSEDKPNSIDQNLEQLIK